MKKLAFVFGVAFVAALAFSSCKKDYTCACTYKLGEETINYEFEIKDAKKADAEAACTFTLVGATSVTCELK
jgi:hypothetical protein